MDNQSIGERLKNLRIARGYSQEQVAKFLGIGRTTYLKYESGENKPTRKLNELAAFFHVTTDYLLGRDAPAPVPDVSQHDRQVLDALHNADENTREVVRVALRPYQNAKQKMQDENTPAVYFDELIGSEVHVLSHRANMIARAYDEANSKDKHLVEEILEVHFDKKSSDADQSADGSEEDEDFLRYGNY